MEAGYLSFGIQMAFVRLSNPSTASGRLLPIGRRHFSCGQIKFVRINYQISNCYENLLEFLRSNVYGQANVLTTQHGSP